MSGMGEPLLRVEDLRTYIYLDEGIVRAANGVSFALDRGQTMAIVGESGSGKSIVAQSILRILPPRARLESARIRFTPSREPRVAASLPPAGDDRPGPRLPSPPPHRRRAGLGPRRHRPGPDPRPPPGPPEGVRPHPPPDHPRSGRGRVRGRPRDRDVLRQGDGDGARRRVLRAPTASLSAGPPP